MIKDFESIGQSQERSRSKRVIQRIIGYEDNKQKQSLKKLMNYDEE